MALWTRGVGARLGGICRSPISSDDEGDVFSCQDKENHAPNHAQAASATSSKTRKQPMVPRKTKPPPASLKRSRERHDEERLPISKKMKTKPRKSEVLVQTSEPTPGVVSKKDLIQSAPLRFVEYLADQLGAPTHALYCEEFGSGQGHMMRLPAATLWGDVRGRREFATWAQQLGFVESPMHRQLYRISSLNVQIVIEELRKRVHVQTESIEKQDDSIIIAEPEAEPRVVRHDALSVNAQKEEVARIQAVRALLRQLDGEELEMLSVAEHDRLLSTIRHEQIADAMEEVLAKPSLRKERDRARRMSKLGRIAERRLSVIPLRQSVLPMTIMEDAEWDEDGEDYGLQHGAFMEDVASSVVPEDEPVFTPRKSPRRRSIGPSTPDETNPVASRRSTVGKTVVFSTPLKSPVKAPRQLATPVRTPQTKKAMTTPHKSPGTKLAQADIKKRHVTNQTILASLFRTSFLGINDLKVCFTVSKMWRDLAVPAYAWSVADYTKHSNARSIEEIYASCPRGHYLSDGAYKEVFKVFSTAQKRLEAVSVMDIRAIESTGNEHIVRQEVAHSLLLSELVRSNFSPHFVEIYDVFIAHAKPHPDRWGNAQRRKPVDLITGGRKSIGAIHNDDKSSADELYQYIHMEFCDGGDVEDFIGLQEHKILPATSVVIPFFFQMVFSIYTARERFHMRHCDIKLLNFFLKDISRKGLKCADDEPLTLQYVIGDDVFELSMPATFSYWVKLADYGTADSNVENLGKPVSLDQFTTLENTPIEFLLEGDKAIQSFAADTFSLGLCMFHLFTGSAPYEEILDTVKCPGPLRQDLKRLWLSNKKNSGFSVLRRVAQDDAEDVLMHTLYRYLVLFGLPEGNPCKDNHADRVWALLLKHLRPAATQHIRHSSRRVAAKQAGGSPQEQFTKDAAEFSLASGNHALMQRARERLARVPGAYDLLKSLVSFDPTSRPTMKQVLQYDVFSSLRSAATQDDTIPRVAHYTIDCYSSAKTPADRLHDV